MNIAVTNDDGPDAEGLAALFEVAQALGTATAVVSAESHSVKSHAVTMSSPIEVSPRQHPALGSCYICDCTPADCVRLALTHLPIGSVDVVLSGINHGANAGVDVYYSGTVAAAREAALLGKTGIAVSQLIRPQQSDNWQRTKDMARLALESVWPTIATSQGPRLFNINLPYLQDGQELQGIKYCPLTNEPLATSFRKPPENNSTSYTTEYSARYSDRPAPPGHDFHYLLNYWITITPLLLDTTDRSRL